MPMVICFNFWLALNYQAFGLMTFECLFQSPLSFPSDLLFPSSLPMFPSQITNEWEYSFIYTYLYSTYSEYSFLVLSFHAC